MPQISAAFEVNKNRAYFRRSAHNNRSGAWLQDGKDSPPLLILLVLDLEQGFPDQLNIWGATTDSTPSIGLRAASGLADTASIRVVLLLLVLLVWVRVRRPERVWMELEAFGNILGGGFSV